MANDYEKLYQQYVNKIVNKIEPIPTGTSYYTNADAFADLNGHYAKQAVTFTGSSITVSFSDSAAQYDHTVSDLWSKVVAVGEAADKSSLYPEVDRRAAYIDQAEHALLDAALHMEAVGWTAGVECQQHTGRVCTWGAVLQAKPYSVTAVMPHHRLAMMLIAEYLEIGGWRQVISWNDGTLKGQYDNDQEIAGKEAVRVMREAWAKSREDRGLL